MSDAFSADLLNRYSFLDDEGRTFVDTLILEELAEIKIEHKQRKLTPVVEMLLNGTQLNVVDVMKTFPRRVVSGKTLAIAKGIMQMVIVSGFRNFPWTELRKNYVRHHISPNLVPDFDPFGNRGPETSAITPDIRQTKKRKIEPQLQMDHAEVCDSKFWRKLINEKNLEELVAVIIEDAETRKQSGRKRKTETNYVKLLIDSLFNQRGSYQELLEDICLSAKTGTWVDVLTSIRKRLNITGLGPRGLLPAPCAVSQMNVQFISKFIEVCKPRATYSGFRIGLVNAVSLVIFLYQGKSDIEGARVDIWGDGVEIGKVDITRMVFRVLNLEADFSSQSSSAAFTFAVFRGKIFNTFYFGTKDRRYDLTNKTENLGNYSWK